VVKAEKCIKLGVGKSGIRSREAGRVAFFFYFLFLPSFPFRDTPGGLVSKGILREVREVDRE